MSPASSFDKGITFLRVTNTTQEAIAQALFKSWFFVFDPFGPRLKGMDAATAVLFSDSFEASELGWVRNGWSVRIVYDVARVIYGTIYAH